MKELFNFVFVLQNLDASQYVRNLIFFIRVVYAKSGRRSFCSYWFKIIIHTDIADDKTIKFIFYNIEDRVKTISSYISQM